MDVSESVRSYQLHHDMDIQGCIYHILEKLSCNLIVRTHLLYKIFIRSCNVVNVSSTKLTNAHARLSRYV
jgi:hypothetical protein